MSRAWSADLPFLLRACCESVGLLASDVPGLPAIPERLSFLASLDAKAICFVLVDGFGAVNMAERLGHCRTLASWDRRELTTVFPSTTAAAITSLGTGLAPGEHAVTSYSLKVPGEDANFSLIQWDHPRVDPLAWQSKPTLFEQMGEAERAQVCLVQPPSYIDSGLTLAALRGGQGVQATFSQRVHAAAQQIRAGKRLCYLYWGELDHAGHRHGWNSQQWTSALEDLDAGMRELTRTLPAGTAIVLSADHGMVDVDKRIDLVGSCALDGVAHIAGEERAVHFYLEEGADERRVAERLAEEFAPHGYVATREELQAWMGELSPRAASTMGELVLLARGPVSFYDSRQTSSHSEPMRGMHGARDEIETAIPLLIEVR